MALPRPWQGLVLVFLLLDALAFTIHAAPTYARGAALQMLLRKKVGEYSSASDWIPIAPEHSPKFAVSSLAEVPVHESAGLAKEDIKIQFYLPKENMYSPWFTFHDYNHETLSFRQLTSLAVTLRYLGKNVKDVNWVTEESEHSNRDSVSLSFEWEVDREEAPELGDGILSVLALTLAVFLTSAILLGGFAENKVLVRTQRAAAVASAAAESFGSSSSSSYAPELTKKDDSYAAHESPGAHANASDEHALPSWRHDRGAEPSSPSSYLRNKSSPQPQQRSNFFI